MDTAGIMDSMGLWLRDIPPNNSSPKTIPRTFDLCMYVHV